MFFLRDPLKFPDLNHAVKRDPRTNLRNPTTTGTFGPILPESLHQVTITMSDRGIPQVLPAHARLRLTHLQHDQRRQASGTGSNSTSARSRASRISPTRKRAQLIGKDRESHGRDLYEAIERGDYPKWTLYIQVMPEADAEPTASTRST